MGQAAVEQVASYRTFLVVVVAAAAPVVVREQVGQAVYS